MSLHSVHFCHPTITILKHHIKFWDLKLITEYPVYMRPRHFDESTMQTQNVTFDNDDYLTLWVNCMWSCMWKHKYSICCQVKKENTEGGMIAKSVADPGGGAWAP